MASFSLQIWVKKASIRLPGRTIGEFFRGKQHHENGNYFAASSRVGRLRGPDT
jgi:hypothetical protein